MSGRSLYSAEFHDDDLARQHIEASRWPYGPVCPKCGGREAYAIHGSPLSTCPARKGLYKCSACRQQFTVTVGTIFEDSHIALKKWLLAIHLLRAPGKRLAYLRLHQMLGVTYKTARFMARRIQGAT